MLMCFGIIVLRVKAILYTVESILYMNQREWSRELYEGDQWVQTFRQVSLGGYENKAIHAQINFIFQNYK
jgi:hypothetical protein